MEHMLLQLKRSPEQELAVQKFIDELQTIGSPNYHHWLTPQEFGQRFGLAQMLRVFLRIGDDYVPVLLRLKQFNACLSHRLSDEDVHLSEASPCHLAQALPPVRLWDGAGVKPALELTRCGEPAVSGSFLRLA